MNRVWLLLAVAIVAFLSCGRHKCPETFEHAPSRVLKADLTAMRQVILEFRHEFGRCPSSLNELVEKRYIRKVPLDPVTKSANTWVYANCSLHSGATGTSCNGQRYASF